MLRKIRNKIELYFLKESFDNLKKGELAKGMRYLRLAVWVAMPTKELSNFSEKMYQLAERYRID